MKLILNSILVILTVQFSAPRAIANESITQTQELPLGVSNFSNDAWLGLFVDNLTALLQTIELLHSPDDELIHATMIIFAGSDTIQGGDLQLGQFDGVLGVNADEYFSGHLAKSDECYVTRITFEEFQSESVLAVSNTSEGGRGAAINCVLTAFAAYYRLDFEVVFDSDLAGAIEVLVEAAEEPRNER